MIRCKIHSCRRYPYQPCCSGCRDFGTCLDRCLNGPDRCGCSVEGALPAVNDAQPAGKKRQAKRPTYDWTEMERLRENGMSNEEIAHKLGCSRNTVDYALRKMRGASENG